MSEQVPYRVERRLDGVEIRSYPATVLVTVNGRPDGEAFSILFRYISGHNRPQGASDRHDTGPSGQKIAMTAPVISGADSFSFAMPASFSIATTPLPVDARSVLEEMPERLTAVVRFAGRATPGSVDGRRRQLLDTLDKHEIRYRGDPFLMRYNPPFTPGFMRRNEVGVELIPGDRSNSPQAA